MEQQGGGFRQWLANQGGTLREQFTIPRDSGGSISWGRFLGQTAAGAALGPFGGIASRALFNPQFQQYGRIAGDSFGRMFDGDNTTGFFNNPSWGGGPRNVAEGHRDFVGPPSPSGTQPSQPAFTPADYARATSQGNWGFQGANTGGGPRNVTLAGNAFNSNSPSHWRDAGTAASQGPDGAGIGAYGFGDFMGSRGTLQTHNYIV